MYVVLDFRKADELEKFLLSKNYGKVELGFGVVAEIDELRVDGDCLYFEYEDDDKNQVTICVGEDSYYPDEPSEVYLVNIADEKEVREVAKQIFENS